MAVIAVIISYFSALNEAREIQDAGLKQIASLIQSNHNNLLLNDNFNNESRIIIQLMPPKNLTKDSMISRRLQLPNKLTDGFHTLTIGKFNYRALKLTLPNQQNIAIAQQTILRDEAAFSGAISTAIPMLLLLPILITAACLMISSAFRPIIELSEDVHQRTVQDLTPFPVANIPIEVRPFLTAINKLFDKVNTSIEVQKRFITDAAHELRSPLTALSLQSERLASSEMSEIAYEHLFRLRQGISRTTVLLEQLLSFAKAQRLTQLEKVDLSINQTILKVLEDLIPIAEARDINIGIKSSKDEILRINETDLISIIKNLIDNAIRFTPKNGQIDLSVIKKAKAVILEIEDSGPGISDGEKERVFDTFYRVLGNDSQGSGLGLSIVKTILIRIGGDITLLDSDSFSSGLKVRVYIPL